MISGRVDQLEVEVFKSTLEMGKHAALAFTHLVEGILKVKEKVRCVFAAAPSQNQFLDYLVEECSVDWSKIEAFHMDEYIGLGANSPASFSYFLKT